LASMGSMAALDPRNAGVSERLRQRRFQLDRFPAAERVEMLEELGKQADAEAVHVPARLVAGLVLIEAEVGVERGLANIETPSVRAAGVLQEHDIERMMRAPGTCGRRAQLPRRALGLRHPFWQVESITHRTTIAQRILQRQQERLEERKEAAKDGKRGKAVTRFAFPISRMTLRRKWEDVRGKAGLSDVTIHDLRRTHSTQAVVAAVDLRTLAGRLGHSNLAMLERHYAALVGTAALDAATKIERAFASEHLKR
jgi:integrase-like protein